MKNIGYAIVGTGYFGAELGRIMNTQEGARIVAVLDPENGETVAKELKATARPIWIRSALVRMWMRSSWLPPTICTRTPS